MSMAGRLAGFGVVGPSLLTSVELAGGDPPPQRTWSQLVSGSPGRLALLWAMAAALGAADVVVFPIASARTVSSTLYLSGASILAGLVAARLLRLKHSTFYFLSALVAARLVATLAELALKLATPAAFDAWIGLSMGVLHLLAIALIIDLGYRGLRSRGRRAVAVIVAIGVNLGAVALVDLDGVFWNLSEEMQPLLGRQSLFDQAVDQPPEIADDLLWGAQRDLVETTRESFQPRNPGRANVYTMAVAGSGSQALFSREAHEALRVASLHFADDSRGGALLSNGTADLMKAPLATRANIADVAHAIGEKADRKQDLLFVYLVSHGSREAELSSDLPNFRPVQAISSASTAEALRKAGVARRIVVVSACFAATWIPALADDDTIVITAAAKDRTSFGCDDSRRLTVFGDAFLSSLAVKDVSLHDAFEDAKRKISAEERAGKMTPSLPQVFVGRNMQSLWLGDRGPGSDRRAVSRRPPDA